MTSFRPVDDETRQRARDDLRKSFVVEAGAGTGKTTLLLDRVENLVRTGAAGLDEIAAVTFTENAATAMKLRLREHLEQARADDSVPGRQRERAARALDVLERAQVSTIHALCAAILQERPLECGVTPGFEVMDDARTDTLFAKAWEQWLSDSLAAGDEPVAIWIRGAGRSWRHSAWWATLETKPLIADRVIAAGQLRILAKIDSVARAVNPPA